MMGVLKKVKVCFPCEMLGENFRIDDGLIQNHALVNEIWSEQSLPTRKGSFERKILGQTCFFKN